MLPRLFIHTRRLSLRQIQTSVKKTQIVMIDQPPPTDLGNKEPGKPDDQGDQDQDQYVDTSMGREWGGPMRGGRFPEPTRFGDWERKGRVTDF